MALSLQRSGYRGEFGSDGAFIRNGYNALRGLSVATVPHWRCVCSPASPSSALQHPLNRSKSLGSKKHFCRFTTSRPTRQRPLGPQSCHGRLWSRGAYQVHVGQVPRQNRCAAAPPPPHAARPPAARRRRSRPHPPLPPPTTPPHAPRTAATVPSAARDQCPPGKHVWLGTMEKRGHCRRNWKRRFFIIDGKSRRMVYYPDESHVLALGECIIYRIEACDLYHEYGLELISQGGKVNQHLALLLTTIVLARSSTDSPLLLCLFPTLLTSPTCLRERCTTSSRAARQ